MGLIKKIIGQLFGSKPEPALSSEARMEKYEMEHRQRLLEAETRLRSWLIPLLREKSNLAVSWECGNDEAIITFEKGVLPDHKEAVDDLEDYLYHKLELPSAGEFTMNGDGNLYMEDGRVKIKYNSVFKELFDYDPELDKEIYGEEWKIEKYCGDVELFSTADSEQKA